MRLTALEIKKKDFQQKMRGIDQDEVQAFLDLVSREVESLFGQGSTFHVWLPLPVAQGPAAAPPEAAQVQLPALHVLIADDIPLSGSPFADANMRRLIALTQDDDLSNRDWAASVNWKLHRPWPKPSSRPQSSRSSLQDRPQAAPAPRARLSPCADRAHNRRRERCGRFHRSSPPH